MIDDSDFLGVQDTLRVEDGKVFNVAEQEFDSSFLAGLQWAREQQNKNTRCKNLHHVASIPSVFYHKWLMQGHDPFTWSKRELFRKLYEEDLTDFITTSKRVI